LEEIASCEVKYGVPVSDEKKVAQLIRLGGKKYGTVITVTQMCKKSKKITCTAKHIVDEMWKQWRIEGGKEKGKENADDEDETTLSKVDEKTKFKGKDRSKAVIFLARRQIRKYAKE
jgi:homospermidine synthase